MDEEVRNAIRASINKYKRYSKYTAEYQINDTLLGCVSCALCRLFMDPTSKITLCVKDHNGKEEKCPVYERTGALFCESTPYNDVCDAQDARDVFMWQDACEDEVEFLESLLGESE